MHAETAGGARCFKNLRVLLLLLQSSCLTQPIALPGPLVNQKLTADALWLMQHSTAGWLRPAFDVLAHVSCPVLYSLSPFYEEDNIGWLSDTCQMCVNPCHMSQYLHGWGWLTLLVVGWGKVTLFDGFNRCSLSPTWRVRQKKLWHKMMLSWEIMSFVSLRADGKTCGKVLISITRRSRSDSRY